MLDPKSNTLDYSTLLIPPEGFLLRRAIGTTYSLDLQALLAIPVAMYYSKPLETNFENNEEPFDVFDAINKASKTVTIFCQKGKIKVPRKFSKLISFTEDCVTEIIPEQAFSSFHPKCWWLWFHHPKTNKKIVRFAVLSRNLTFDRSWDVAFCFEGTVTKEKQPQNKSMLDMIKYLESVSEKKVEEEFKTELEKTIFLTELPFKNWNFYPIGIGESFTNPLSGNYYRPDSLIMMSPFIDDESVLNLANKVSDKCWLFSRKTELQNLEAITFESLTNSYCIQESVVNGEWADIAIEDVPDIEPDLLDLHAKLYVSRKGNTNTWFLGSANLSKPAFGRNIECLMELKTDDYQASPESILKQLVSKEDERKLFEEFIPSENKLSDGEEDIKQLIRRLEFGIIKCPFYGKVKEAETKGFFCYEMIFDAKEFKIGDGFKIQVNPFSPEMGSDLGRPLKTGVVNEIIYKELFKESQLSRFFIFNISHKGVLQKSFLLKADLKNIPETRSGKIFSEIINSKEKFLQYMKFILNEKGIVDDVTKENGNNKSNGQNTWDNSFWSKFSIPLYEELLKASSQQPYKLKSIDDVMNKLMANEETKDVIPTELLELWGIFKQVIK